jgi:hypothetical protein
MAFLAKERVRGWLKSLGQFRSIYLEYQKYMPAEKMSNIYYEKI